MATRVLLVGFDKTENENIKKIYGAVQVATESLASIESAMERIPTDPPALVLAEEPASLDSLKALDLCLKAHAPSTAVLVTLKSPSLNRAVDAMRLGAYDCLKKPLQRFDLLVATKRATSSYGRSIIVPKIVLPKRRLPQIILVFVCLVAMSLGIWKLVDRSPSTTLSLDSKYLSGIQWEKRSLWVGDWFNATVTQFRAKRGLTKKSRRLITEGLYRMKEGQPILVCHTPEGLFTVGTDLQLRSHKWDVGLPQLQTIKIPGTNPTGLAWDGNSLWSVDGHSGFLYRYDRFLRVLQTERSLIPRPEGLAWGEGSLWVLGSRPLQIARLEKVDQGYVWRGPYSLLDWIPLEKKPTGMAIGFGRLWLGLDGDSQIVSKSLSSIIKAKSAWKRAEKKE